MSKSVPSSMHRALGSLALIAGAGSLSGCAIVRSLPDDPAAASTGLVYHLPKAVLPVELVETTSAIVLRVQPPRVVADPAHRYLLHHPVNAFSGDNLKIEVDPATQLLSKITMDSTDQSLAVLTELAKLRAIGRAELSTGGTDEVVLANGHLDPDADAPGAARRNSELTARLQAALLARMTQLKATDCAPPAATDDKCKAVNALLPGLMQADARKETVVTVAALPLGAEPASAASAPSQATAPSPPAADCQRGICHRSLRPYEVTLAIGSAYQHSTLLMLPNGTAPVALPLERAAFVKTEHTVEFEAGQIKSLDTKRPSSALALVKWPLDVYQSVLQATATLIQLRIGDNAKSVELAESQLTTAKELKRIADELAALKAKGGAELSMTDRNAGRAVLSVEIGQRQVPRKAAESLLPSQPPTSPTPGNSAGQPSIGAPVTDKSKGG